MLALDIKNTSLLPIKDTFADSNHPTQTYGNSELLSLGNYNRRITETFLSFKISSKYRNLTSANYKFRESALTVATGVIHIQS